MPLEMLESVLMTAFLMLYVTDFERDDDQPAVILGKSRSSERRGFRLLSSVCSYWYQTLIGWPESPTSQWVKHQLQKLIERKFAYCYTNIHIRMARVVLYRICSKFRTLSRPIPINWPSKYNTSVQKWSVTNLQSSCYFFIYRQWVKIGLVHTFSGKDIQVQLPIHNHVHCN